MFDFLLKFIVEWSAQKSGIGNTVLYIQGMKRSEECRSQKAARTNPDRGAGDPKCRRGIIFGGLISPILKFIGENYGRFRIVLRCVFSGV